MFQELKPLLATSGEIKLTIRADGDKLKVIVIPTTTDAKSEIALARPLVMCDTAEELDAGFLEAIRGFTATRSSLAEQVVATNTILKAAEQEQAKKATTRSTLKTASGKPGAVKPAVASGVQMDDSDLEGDDEGKASGGNTVTLPASNSSDAKPESASFTDLAGLSI